MPEINLLENYPQTKRNVEERGQAKSEADRAVAREFGREYFDGDRRFGYGGYSYQPRFWEPVVPVFQKYYGLTANSSILDVGCAKGFMLYDFQRLIPGITVAGVDVSAYALEHSLAGVKPYLRRANAQELPFPDGAFDLAISINTIHNLPAAECKKALAEIQRVTRRHAFITVDAYRNEAERKRMELWNLTALTYRHVGEWTAFFKEAGYRGDYYWFIP